MSYRISQEQFIKNYEEALEPHDARVRAVISAKEVARGYMSLLGGHYECNAQNINVLSMPGETRKRYFSDDELIEMTTKEN